MVIIMKKISQILRNKQSRFVLGGGLAVGAGSANAASYLPAIVGTSFSQITGDFTTLTDTYIWPLMMLVLATFFMMRIVKRGAGSAG